MTTRKGTVYGLYSPPGDDVSPSLLATSHQNIVSGHQGLSQNVSHIEEDAASNISRKSSQTSSSAASVRAKAKAEAAKANLQFAKKKAELMKQEAQRAAQLEAQEKSHQAQFKADLMVLEAEQEAAVASAEESVYEVAELENLERINIDASPTNVMDRTREFVTSHFSEEVIEGPVTSSSTQAMAPRPIGNANQTGSSPDYTGPQVHFSQTQTFPVNQQPVQHQTFYSAPPRPSQHPMQNPVFSFQQPIISHTQSSPEVYQHLPNVYQPLPTAYQPVQAQQPDPFISLTKHLMKKELISTGLLKFDDNPANFRAWKASFKAATEDLELTAAQELNLVMKWLGEKSVRIVAPVRSINIENPKLGLKMVWEALEKKYGTAEVLEDNLMSRLENFPRINSKDREKLLQLSYLLLEVQAAKQTGIYKGLATLDSAKGLKQMVEKLPYPLQERWMRVGTTYKRDNNVTFPPFEVFVNFISKEADMRNDVSFIVSSSSGERNPPLRFSRANVTSVSKTAVAPNQQTQVEIDPSKTCVIHGSSHALRDCRAFQKKSINERKQLLLKNRVCFKCCSSTLHRARDCAVLVKCSICNSDRHLFAMHIGQANTSSSRPQDGGEDAENQHQQPTNDASTAVTEVTNACTSICGTVPGGRSCSKICKVNVLNDVTGDSVKVYAVIDDQSNSTLAKPELLDKLNITSNPVTYKMKTCGGVSTITGRSTNALSVSTCDGGVSIKLPHVRECRNVPDNYSEIPIPEIAQAYPHLANIVDKVEPIEPGVPIALLIGRDVPQAHKVREQFDGPNNTPFGQRLDLGWVIIGESCLDITANDVPSSCESYVTVMEDVFATNKDDNVPANSIEDQQFLKMLETEAKKNETGNWEMPLPFRTERKRLPNNKPVAIRRFNNVARRIKSNPKLAEQYKVFMQKLFDNGHAEPAPPLRDNQEVFYLPFFEVFHPMKPDKIRVVYDSSAKYEGTSLNDVLMGGPDLNNSLLGVLLRFRKEPVAIMADIEQMFYNFYVREDHRDYLRFLWFKDNDLSEEPIDYRMKVHVFGNKPSPSVAIGLLAKAADEGIQAYGKDASAFVKRNFYVDDGLTSTSTPEEAIDILKRTKAMLSCSNINLHKVASNCQEVMEAFNPDDVAKDLKNINLSNDEPPLQRSLGIYWDLKDDMFHVKVSQDSKEFTRRGMLSIVNSLFDPLGFASPVTLKGRLLMRELAAGTVDWDDPIEAEKKVEWDAWLRSLEALNDLTVPRCYTGVSLKAATKTELVIFCDASSVAIGAVAYLVVHHGEQCRTGFMMAKSKVAPKPAHTIPRLELCAAVLAVEIMETIVKEIDIEFDNIRLYTDSRVVLGYINNTSRRFYTYVANRVSRIRQSSSPSQWNYVHTSNNPADLATRPNSAAGLRDSDWFEGPAFLNQAPNSHESVRGEFDLIEPDADIEVYPETTTLMTNLERPNLGSHRFSRFSDWTRLQRTIAKLIQVARGFQNGNKGGWQRFQEPPETSTFQSAKCVILSAIQKEGFSQEIECLKTSQQVNKKSPLRSLSPFIGQQGLVRVGGRCERQEVPYDQRHPTILPQKSHITDLVVRHFHEELHHQGRKLTEGAIRSAGYWITGSKRLVSTMISKCVTCKKLRGSPATQKMADLPADRIQPCPPFTSVGLDVFGPWEVITRKTRGGSANSKRWAVIFTCMYSRAVHIEVLESMTTSSMINALRRFFAFRGPAKVLRSDQATNFVGAAKELKLIAENSNVKELLQTKYCNWLFNPPKASHMGGAWERMIGTTRKVLDSILKNQKGISHEVLTTVLCEAMEIVNSRPLVDVSTDPDLPTVLTPATLLTQKFDRASAPQVDVQRTSYSYQDQWKQVQILANAFEEKWKQEYLSSITPRQKWTEETPNIKLGDIVVLKEDGERRREWPLGRVIEAPQSDDGRVRRIKLKVARGNDIREYTRPISKIVKLLSEDE